MNNILSLKTVGLSYASTNLSFAFALYFNISMFLLYHNPPLFSITRRTCPNVFLFGVQIPVDACTFLGLKRRSFLFVIDKKQPLLRLFLYTGRRTLILFRTKYYVVESAHNTRFLPYEVLCHCERSVAISRKGYRIKTCTLLLFFRQGKTVRNTDGFLLFGFIVFC